MFQNPADYWGLSPEQANRLPLGLRKSNNLFNVKYYGGAERNQIKWPGLIGPSEARDQGDPQMKFGSVDDSGVAGAQLLRRKYDSGMRTPNQIIAGQNGWTPGYQGAANNVARLAGVESGDDLKLDSPDGMRRMLPALAEQEHGPDVAKNLFTDDMWDRIAEKATGAQFASGELPKLSYKQFASDSGLTPQEQDISSRRWDDAPTKPVQSEANVAGWNSNEQRATRQGARQPMDEEQQPGLLDNLAGRTIYNPGFQQGLGLFLAASQGKDLNEGLNSGVARGGSLFAQHQKMVEMRRQQATQMAMRRMLDDPSKFKDMPADVREAARFDPSIALNYAIKHPDMVMERQKLQLGVDNLRESVAGREQARKQHELTYPLEVKKTEAQVRALDSKGPMQQLEEDVARTILENRRRNQTGSSGPAIGQQPQIIPQSFEGGGTPQQAQPAFAPTGGGAISTGDPNFIRTQAATSGAQSPQQGGAQEMVDVPGLGKMSKADAEGLAYIQSKDRGKYIDEKLSKHDLGKHTTDKMNEKQFNAIEQVSRLNTVADAFDPKFLTLGETVKQAKLSWQEYLTGSIPPESEADRSKYVTFQQSTLNNLNKYIQEMTGAAMSDGEAARLKAAMPNMNMDPTQFKTALNNVRSQSLLAIARYNYLRDTQFKGKAWDAKEVENHTSIDGMRKIIHDRRDQLLKDIRSEYPKANEADVQNAVKARIGRQFGIDA